MTGFIYYHFKFFSRSGDSVAKELCCLPKDAGSIPSVAAAFQMKAESKNAHVFRFRLLLRISRWPKLIQNLHYGVPHSPAVALACKTA